MLNTNKKTKMAYIKRLAMPKTWPLPRKGSIYVARPLPGRELKLAMPLCLIIKHLNFAKSGKEVKFMLKKNQFIEFENIS